MHGIPAKSPLSRLPLARPSHSIKAAKLASLPPRARACWLAKPPGPWQGAGALKVRQPLHRRAQHWKVPKLLTIAEAILPELGGKA